MAHNILRTCGLIATSMVSVMANAQTGANRLPNIVFVLAQTILARPTIYPINIRRRYLN